VVREAAGTDDRKGSVAVPTMVSGSVGSRTAAAAGVTKLPDDGVADVMRGAGERTRAPRRSDRRPRARGPTAPGCHLVVRGAEQDGNVLAVDLRVRVLVGCVAVDRGVAVEHLHRGGRDSPKIEDRPRFQFQP